MTLPPETEAVLLCAQVVLGIRDSSDLRPRLARCEDLDQLVRVAVRHGMFAQLCRVVEGMGESGLPPGAEERLRTLSAQAAQRALTQTSQLFRLLDLFSTNGVQAVTVKGPVWAELLYGDVTLRSWVDLDIIVPFEHAATVVELLHDEGLSCDSRFPDRVLRPTGQEGELQFRAMGADLSVDLHWQMGVGQSRGALSGETLLARAAPMQLLGREVLTTSPVDTLLLSCLHGTRHRWDTIELLLGLAVQIDRIGPAGWPSVMDAARAAGCRRRVTVAAAHTCRVFGLPLPAPVATALSSDRVAQAFTASLTPETLCGEPAIDRRQHFSSLLWTLALEDSAAGNLAHLTVRFFLPGPQDWEAYSLPPRLAWLYWPLRPGRLVVRVARMASGRAA